MEKRNRPGPTPEEIAQTALGVAEARIARLFLEGGIITNRGRIFTAAEMNIRPLFFSREAPIDVSPELKEKLSYHIETDGISFRLGYMNNKNSNPDRILASITRHVASVYSRLKVPAQARRDPGEVAVMALVRVCDIWGKGESSPQ